MHDEGKSGQPGFDLFEDVKVQGLLAQQSEVLTSYIETGATAKDVAIKMSTGAGKTLVGLLLCEWRRRKDKHRVVYQLSASEDFTAEPLSGMAILHQF